MNKKTQTYLIIAGVGILAYVVWKKNKEKAEFSNAGGIKKWLQRKGIIKHTPAEVTYG
jgi:hypothetical protein